MCGDIVAIHFVHVHGIRVHAAVVAVTFSQRSYRHVCGWIISKAVISFCSLKPISFLVRVRVYSHVTIVSSIGSAAAASATGLSGRIVIVVMFVVVDVVVVNRSLLLPRFVLICIKLSFLVKVFAFCERELG